MKINNSNSIYEKHGFFISKNIFFSFMILLSLSLIPFSAISEHFFFKKPLFSRHLVENYRLLFIFVPYLALFFSIIFLFFPKIANIRIGGVDAKPIHKNFVWFSLVFSSSVSILLMVSSIYSPLILRGSPLLPNVDSLNITATVSNLYNWSFFGWSLITITGLSMSYYVHNLGLPLLPRTLFYPILKNRIFGFIGTCIDTFTLFSILYLSLFSLQTTSLQLNTGASEIFSLSSPENLKIYIYFFLLSVLATIIFTTLDKLITIISVTLFLFFSAPFFTVIRVFPFKPMSDASLSSIYLFFTSIPSLPNELLNSDVSYLINHTFFYWSWWAVLAIGFSLFLAHISYGRTFQQFIFTVLFLPSLFTVIFLSILSFASIYISDTFPEYLYPIIKTPTITLYRFNFFTFKLFNLSMSINFFTILTQVLLFLAFNLSCSVIMSQILSEGKNYKNHSNSFLVILLQLIIAIFILFFKKGQFLTISSHHTIIILGFICFILIFFITFSFVYQLYKNFYKKD